MTLEKYRDEISIYHDLGASNSFIQRPYLYQGLFLAIAGALLSVGMVLLSYYSLVQDLAKIEELLGYSISFNSQDLIFMSQFLVAVIVFAWICSFSSIRKWLNIFDKNHHKMIVEMG